MSLEAQARRFDTLLDALNERQGDVVAAAIPDVRTVSVTVRTWTSSVMWNSSGKAAEGST